MYNKILLFLLLAVIKVSRPEDGWTSPYFEAVEREEVNKTEGGKKVEIYLHENVPVPFLLGHLTATGNPPAMDPIHDYFEIVDDNGVFQIKTKKEIDYEKITKHEFFVQHLQEGVEFIINVVNLNDNEIIVRRTSENCEIKENLEGPSTCVYEVSDKDGISEHFNININPDVSDKFEFKWEGEIFGKKQIDITLNTLIKLDYEQNTIFVFDFTLKDEVEKHQAKSTVVLDVIDEPDTKPKWINIISSKQFNENEEQTIEAVATDGDYGVKSPIEFECINESPELQGLLTCNDTSESVPPNYKIKIQIGCIDRDVLDSDTLKFTLKATEVLKPFDFIEQEINLIIKDVNDNIPTISLSHTNEISIEENKFTKLDELIEITIDDKDLGDFGTYQVGLTSSKIPDVTKIFQIVPSSGYQETSFALTLINFAALDYDRTDLMREFSLKIIVKEKVESTTKEIAKEIKFSLINWNDEVPIFKNAAQKIQIYETVGRKGPETLQTTDLYATDDDDKECDSVHYNLLGSINKILTYNNSELTTINDPANKNQIFDYETQINHYFQLEARDNFTCDQKGIVNRAYAEIEIELLDVNDETPSLIINEQNIQLKENSDDGKEILIIKATDPDTENDLEIGIDWRETKATKDRSKVDFSNYEGCFFIDECQKSKHEVECKLILKDVVSKNTPDFEKFDTINLHIYVIDKNQTEGINKATATLIINVEDVNDCPPEFTKETIESNKTVTEETEIGTIITNIRATDNDTNSNITYSLKANEGLVKIDPNSGVISVKKTIDADTIPEKYLNYTVVASDTVHETCLEISIYVKDINDNTPEFKVVPGDYEELYENVKAGEKVVQIQGIDKDRDHPNNYVTYRLVPNDFFVIGRNSGQIEVSQDGLDREAQEVHEITVILNDNPDDDSRKKESQQTFRVILQDENDEYPVITTSKISLSESAVKGNEIGTIKAEDKDKEGTLNSKIEFKLKSLRPKNNEGRDDLLLENFEKVDKDNGEIAIKTNIDLKNFFGNYSLEVFTNDKGTPPLSCNKTIDLIIERYPFDAPQFSFPKANEKILLKKNQDLQKTLIKYDNKELEFISAYHGDENRPKYDITFDVKDDSNTFKIERRTNTKAELLLMNTPALVPYNIAIIATDETGRMSESPVTIKFVDDDNPYFEGERKLNCTFLEDEEGVEKKEKCQLPQAKYSAEEIELPIFYLINEDKNAAFECTKDENDIGWLSLKKPIYLENYTDYLLIQASKSDPPTNIPKDDSLLQVRIILKDVNNHAPEFESKAYAHGIMIGGRTDAAIFAVKANDLDPDDVLKYFMEDGSFEAVGEYISEGTFTVKENGDVMQNFQVLANMNGYFQFNVIVNDTKYTDKAKVKIYVISERHLVPFYFTNTKAEVEANQDKLLEALNKVINEEFVIDAALAFECQIHYIEKAPVEGSEGKLDDTRTLVKAYFVDHGQNIAMESDEVIRIFNKPEVLVNLDSSIKRLSTLVLDNYVESVALDNSKMLMAWLIGVSVVLGSLCILLIVAFIVKNRSWNRRLDKLTTVKFESQESKLNIAAPPTTNRRAVEGSNPVFNMSDEMTDYKRNSTFDDVSMSSGDSDLVGVENNPAFQQ